MILGGSPMVRALADLSPILQASISSTRGVRGKAARQAEMPEVPAQTMATSVSMSGSEVTQPARS
jgi:hypothetical protein